MTPTELKKHDVVITTYNVVVSEYDSLGKNRGEPNQKKLKGGSSKTSLFEVRWKVIFATPI
jgi:hypothetical protein